MKRISRNFEACGTVVTVQYLLWENIFTIKNINHDNDSELPTLLCAWCTIYRETIIYLKVQNTLYTLTSGRYTCQDEMTIGSSRSYRKWFCGWLIITNLRNTIKLENKCPKKKSQNTGRFCIKEANRKNIHSNCVFTGTMRGLESQTRSVLIFNQLKFFVNVL